MAALISLIIGSWDRIYALLSGIGIVVYSFLITRNSKLNAENELLNKEVEDIRSDTDKIVTIQRKQAEIASAPPCSRADLYEQLRQIASRRSKIEP